MLLTHSPPSFPFDRRAGTRAARYTILVAIVASVAPAAAIAQRGGDSWWRAAAVEGEEERYLRALQVVGAVAPRAWSLRPGGDDVAIGDLLVPGAAHPWSARTTTIARTRPIIVVRPTIGLTYNSAFPFGHDDGAVWAGRGATVSATGGVDARWRWLTVRAAPLAFWTQNAAFDLAPNGLTGHARFGSIVAPLGIDLPQRYGDGSYARLDPGQSTIRVDVGGVVLGASSANEVWGPARVDPLVLGTNAAGIPRAFFGTSRPARWWGGTVHVRAEAGTLHQSSYASTSADSALREMAGIVGVVTVRGLDGLELGAGRFYHRTTTKRLPRLSAFAVPFESVLKGRLSGKDTLPGDNQLASVFARWAVPAARLEVYGEYGRNDHNQDVRDLSAEPDHDAAYTIGLQRSFASPRRLVVVRAETMNSRISHLTRVRLQSPWAVHSAIRQGHTQYGELLGSASAMGGAATTVGVDVYVPSGRWTFEVARRVRQQPIAEAVARDSIDVFALGQVQRLWFTRAGDLTATVAGVAELNRDFRRDVYGVHLSFGWRP